MSYCLNPACLNPQNLDEAAVCLCGAKLRLGDRYLPLKAIGQGGFGRTFLAVDQTQALKPLCVIKQFFPQALGTDSRDKAAELFRQEALRLKELGHHAQIPELIDFLEQEGQQYLVQEFIDGRNLEQELAEQGRFSETQIRQLLNDLLPVLQFVHDRQVIHRDIKPANIIRRSTDQKLVLVDLGAAKYATGTALAKTGTVIGSAEFTAPEQTRGKAVFASDIYSLGATCIHLLTQISPFDLFDSSDDRWVWRDYLSQPVSYSLGQLLDKMLQSGTKRRYQSANQVLEELNSTPRTEAKIAQVSRSPTSIRLSKEQPIYTFINAGSVVAIALSPDGQKLIGSLASRKTSENGIKIWDLQTGKLVGTLRQTVWVNAIVVSPDGETLIGGDTSGTLKFWNLQGELTHRIRAHSVQITSIALSSDGQTLATGSADSTIKLWNIQTRELIQTLRHLSKRVTAIAISPDGQLLVSSDFDSTLSLWHLQTGELLQTLPGNAINGYSSIAISLTGCIVACGSSTVGGNGTIHIWEMVDGKLSGHRTFKAHVGLVQVVTVSPDGKLLASGSRDMTIKLWDLHSKEEIRTIRGHYSPIQSLIFSPDGNQVISGDDAGVIKVWSVEPTDMRYFNRPNALTSEFQSEDRSWRWSLADNQADLVSDQDDQVSKSQIEMDGTQENLLAQYFSRPDLLDQEYELGTQLRRSGNIDISFGKGGSIAPIDDSEDRSLPVAKMTVKPLIAGSILLASLFSLTVSTMQHVKQSRNTEPIRTLTSSGKEAYVHSIALSPKGQTLASSSASSTYNGNINSFTVTDEQIELWDLNTGEQLGSLPDAGWVNAISPNGQTLVSGSNIDGTIKFWNLQSKQLIRTIQGQSTTVDSVAITPDGQILATDSFQDGTIKLWNLQNGTRIRTFYPPNGVTAIAISSDGQTLASTSDTFASVTTLWNLHTGKLVRTLLGDVPEVQGAQKAAITISPDGRTLAVSGYSYGDRTGKIDLWNSQTGGRVRTLRGQGDIVQAVAFSPNGQILAVGYLHGDLELWNSQTGERICTIQGDKTSILSIVFSPDGKTVIAGTGGGKIKIWAVP